MNQLSIFLDLFILTILSKILVTLSKVLLNKIVTIE